MDLAGIGYDGLHADEDLEDWRNGSLHPASQELIAAVRAQGIEGAALLDIGAGVGAVHLTLLEAGAATAVDVDASPEYLAVARAEAERRGLSDAGFRNVHEGGTREWRVVLYHRAGASPAVPSEG